MCWMEYEIQGKTENWLKLEKDGEGVELLGEKLILYKSFMYFWNLHILCISASRLLLEYEIQKEVLQTTSVNNVSRAYLKFVFRRRIEYHVTSTFLQVLNWILYPDFIIII